MVFDTARNRFYSKRVAVSALHVPNYLFLWNLAQLCERGAGGSLPPLSALAESLGQACSNLYCDDW